MLISVFAACADKGNEDQGITSSENEEGDVYDQALAQISADFGGEDFCVLGRNDAANSVTEIHREETSTDPLEDAVYRRNMTLSEMCKLNYLTSLVGTEEVSTKITNDIRSGSGEYAIAMPNMQHAGNMATQNMLMDFKDMTYIDLDAEWWDQGAFFRGSYQFLYIKINTGCSKNLINVRDNHSLKNIFFSVWIFNIHISIFVYNSIHDNLLLLIRYSNFLPTKRHAVFEYVLDALGGEFGIVFSVVDLP